MFKLKWKLPALIGLATVMILASGCAAKPIELAPAVQIICPRLIEYPSDLLARAADEVETLPENSVLVVLLNDYGGQRNRARACRAEARRND